MALRLFGFTLNKRSEDDQLLRSPVAPTKDDSAIEIGSVVGGANQRVITNDYSFKSENALITKYREAAGNPEVDDAIEEIVGDAIVIDDSNVDPITVKFADETSIPPKLKKVIDQEFKDILTMLDFRTNGHDIFRRWYIDGRVFFHKVVDETNPKEGIQQLRYIDPRKLKKVREYQRADDMPVDQFSIMNNKYVEYWVFSEEGIDSAGQSFLTNVPSGINTVIIANDSIAWSNSGLFDPSGQMIISRLHKILRTLNQYRMLEDAAVIYHLTHSVVRRKFKISVNNLSKPKAEQAMKEAIAKFKNKLTYNASTGELNEDRRFMPVTEDFWFAVRDGEAGSDVEPFDGRADLGEVDQVVLFRDKLFRGLNVPAGRMEQGNSPLVDLGAGNTQISREELKFARFIEQLRARFSRLFYDLLKTQLVLKGIMTPEEFEEIKQDVLFEYARDSYFAELKELEVVNQKILTLIQALPLIGDTDPRPVISREWAYRNLLQADDDLINKLLDEINTEFDQALGLQQQYQAATTPPPQDPDLSEESKAVTIQDIRNLFEEIQRKPDAGDDLIESYIIDMIGDDGARCLPNKE